MTAAVAGRVTLHALDTCLGAPARGLGYELYRIDGEAHLWLGAGRTNEDGRADTPVLQGEDMRAGNYELRFGVEAYRVAQGNSPGSGFYDVIPIRFRIGDPTAHYHVPLILAAYGYSTYRGS